MSDQVMWTAGDVILNGVTLNTVDELGNRWIVSDIDGWWDMPESVIPDRPRSFTQDGSFYQSGKYLARAITITGVIVPGWGGSPREAVVSARRRLSLALDTVRSSGTLQVNESDSPKFARVRLVARPGITISQASGQLQFTAELRAVDPRKYSVEEYIASTNLLHTADGREYNKTYNETYGTGELSSTGELDVFNQGSYNTTGTIKIYGPVENPIIEQLETGNVIALNYTVPQDEYVELNLANRTAYLSASPTANGRRKVSPLSTWFELPPGHNTFRFTGVQNPPPREETPFRQNWVYNPSVENVNYSLSFGSFGTAPTLSRDNTTSYSRTYSLKSVWSATAESTSCGLTFFTGASVPVSYYSASIRIKSSVVADYQLDAVNALYKSEVVSAGPGGWSTLTIYFLTDAPGVVTVFIRRAGGPAGFPNSSTVWVDGAVIEQVSGGETARNYVPNSSFEYDDAVYAVYRRNYATRSNGTLATVPLGEVGYGALTLTNAGTVSSAANTSVDLSGLPSSISKMIKYTATANPATPGADTTITIAHTNTGTTTSGWPVVAGEKLGVSGYYRRSWANVGAFGALTAFIDWRNGAGALLSTVTTLQTTELDHQWHRWYIEGTAPAGAAYATIRTTYVIPPGYWATGQFVNHTGLLAEKQPALSGVPGTFFGEESTAIDFMAVAAPSGGGMGWEAAGYVPTIGASTGGVSSFVSTELIVESLSGSSRSTHSAAVAPLPGTTSSYIQWGSLTTLPFWMYGEQEWTVSASCYGAAPISEFAVDTRTITVDVSTNGYTWDYSFRSPQVITYNEWVRVSVSFLVPDEAVGIRIRLNAGGSAVAGSVTLWDNLMIDQGLEARDYFDGNFFPTETSYYVWSQGPVDPESVTSEITPDYPDKIFMPYFDGASPGAVWNGTADASRSTSAGLEAIPPARMELTYRSAWLE
jgi:hypothetical protein